MLQTGTGLYIVLLLAMGATGHVEFVIVTEVLSIGLALSACGSGASKVKNVALLLCYVIIIHYSLIASRK